MNTLDLCAQLVEIADAPLPRSVQAHLERLIFNGIACGVAGSRHADVQAIARASLPTSGERGAPVPGSADLFDLYHAALLTGASINVDDFDDADDETLIHSTCVNVAAAISLAEAEGASGRRFLTAFGLGSEVQMRVARSVSPELIASSLDPNGVTGPIGAAVTASVLLGLSAREMANAIGIAASCTAGQFVELGTGVKALVAGKAAASGVMAALLTREGFTGSLRVLEAPKGYASVVAPGTSLDRICADLGERWIVEEMRAKRYPCAAILDPVIDAAVQAHGASAEVVDEAVLTCAPIVVDVSRDVALDGGLAAKLSAAHCVAAALLEGEVGLPQFTDTYVRAPHVAALRSRVRVEIDPALGRNEASLALRSRGKLVHTRGHLRPMRDEDLRAKAAALVGDADELWRAVTGVADADGIGALSATLGPQRART